MAQTFKLPLSPELEALRTTKPGARKRQDFTSPRVKLSAPPIQPDSEPRSAPPAPGDASTYLNCIGGIVWTQEQDEAFAAGACWEEVEAMAPRPGPPQLNRPFARPKP